jgi:valacyclovir hydrolase
MPYAELNTGVRLHYEDVGDGVPVIAIHGWIGTARDHLGHVIDWLSNDYRVIAPTLRGYGLSRPPERDFPNNFYERDAGDIIALMDALDIERAHIMGYSDGGEVTLIAAGTHPARFYSAATWGSTGYFLPELRAVAQRSAPATFLINDPALCEQHGITNPKGYVADWIRAFTFMVDRGGDVSLHLAPNMTMPVLLMLGDKDTLNPIAGGQRFVDAAPHGKLEVFKDTGHPVHDEQPEQFRQVVGAHLKAATP